MLVRRIPTVLLLYSLLHVSATMETPQINMQQLYMLLFRVMVKLPASECKNQLQVMANALNNNEQWVLAMLDATAKPQAGLLMGNFMHVGNYHQCLRIDETVNSERIQGKYCTGMLKSSLLYEEDLNDWMQDYIFNITNIKAEENAFVSFLLSYGFCVPKVCTVVNLQNLSDILEKEMQSVLHFTFEDRYCHVDEPRQLTTSAIVGIAVFSSFAVIILLSTLYDIFIISKKGPSLWTAFSVFTNTKRLLSSTSTEGNLNCLNGLRVISLMWIIVGHEFQNAFIAPRVNALDLAEWRDQVENGYITAISMAVDTFFIVSGLLVVYLFMKSRDKGVRFNLPMFYLHRILRLTPSLGMLILFYDTLYNYVGDGPFWPIVDITQIEACRKYWWSTLIYLQNYINPNDQCLGHSWYLAVDTQMYFLSPLILFPLIKWPKYTIGAISIFTILICAYVFEITWKKRFASTAFDFSPELFRSIYTPTHIRGTVYLLGMICGYFVYKTKTRPLKLSKATATLLWICSLSVMVAIVFGHGLLTPIQPYNPLASSSFNSLTRVSWSIALSVIILLCVNGYGGLINSFLSSEVFTVLIRLNYNIYLLHIPIIVMRVAQKQVPTYYSTMTGLRNFWGNYAFTVGAAFVWTLAFESPVQMLEKIIFGGGKPKPKPVDGSVAIQICENGDSAPTKNE